MKKDKVNRIAAFSTIDEIQSWMSGIGKYVSNISPKVLEAEKVVCGACPFRNKKAIGGCITEDCPVFILRREINRTVARTGARAKELYTAKYSTSRSV